VHIRSLATCALILGGLAAATPAAADVDLVVLGPATIDKVAPAHAAHVKDALAKAALAPPVDRAIDGACSADPGCLITAGTELGARRLLAVAVTDAGHDDVKITLSYVDVIGKELVALRDVTLADRKIAKELAPAITKFMTEAPTERAKVLFAEGNQHFNLGELEQALELYKSAYRIKPLPAFLFNIAQCQRKLGHHQEAITMYQAYLVGVPDADNKATVESLIDESKAAIVEQQRLDAQRETERLAAEQKRAEELRKAKEAEATAAVEDRKAEQARLAAEREDDKRYNHHTARKWTIGTGALGAAALITGGVFGIESRSAQSSYDSAGCGDPSHLLGASGIAACESDRNRGQHDATVANAFLIGGGAALLLSAVVFTLDPGNLERPDRPRAAIAVSPSAIHLVVAW
jgi:tetratricopeptide (TPR) repeat protein